ncbi:uncharacterized protein V1510DRAFT_375085 [Dipodascopsis tothii]|uniref:uncharacterized protein n=1 Tax=Dipodascopsis tothii TaxID=44089 RepID=UPI0034CF79C1
MYSSAGLSQGAVPSLGARRRAMSPQPGLASTVGAGGRPTNASLAAKQRKELTDEQRREIEEAFRLFDMDRDNKIDYHELKVAMKALGFEADNAEVLRIINDNDRAGQKRITNDAFMRVMTSRVLARDPLEEIERAFNLFDEDQTGKISLHNLRKVSKDLNENLADEELEAMINEFDTNGDGYIDLEEFIAICSDY